MRKLGAKNFVSFLGILEYIRVLNLHIMGLKERFTLIMIFIIIKFALCHNLDKIQCW